MKKSAFLSVLTIVTTLFFLSCSSKNERIELPVSPKEATIQGQLSPYFEVVGSTYKLIKPENQSEFTLKLEILRTNEPFDFDFDVIDMGGRGFVEIYCDLYDESGVPVIIADGWGGRLMMNESGATNMIGLDFGETTWIEIAYGYNFEKEDFEKAKTFFIRSEFDNVAIQSRSSVSYSSESYVEIEEEEEEEYFTGNTDWNKVLADYEAYTDKYIQLMQKANAGDLSAMTDYIEMLEKAQEFQESLESADDNLTPLQLQRFNKIQLKLLNAASDF